MRSHVRRAASLLLVSAIAHAAPWPGATTSTDISAELLAALPAFEPSGIVWHAGRETFIVVGDGGDIAEITDAGVLVQTWSPGHNLESIAVADPIGSVVYVGGENESTIYAFDLDTGVYTGATWDISAYVYSIGMLGFEALAWVPDGAHAHGSTASGGVFYAGWQEDADIYVFAPDLGSSGTLTYLDQLHTTAEYTDLSALEYNDATGTLFALYDGADRLEELEVDTAVLIATYSLPDPGAWEGVAMRDGCPGSASGSITLGDDARGINTYGAFPFACLILDADGDGVNSDIDCDDADASTSTDATYWRDGDGDGYGDPAAGASSCGPPIGFVNDATDCDDAAAGISPGSVEVCDADQRDEDCDGLADDDDPSVSGQGSFYEDADGDGVGSANVILACQMSVGYATSSTDCDDADAADFPGAPETTGNGDDEDCDGSEICFWDGDSDGYRPNADASPTVVSADADCGDVGEASDATAATDCNDGEATMHPGAADVDGDGVDQDCEGSDEGGKDPGAAECGCASTTREGRAAGIVVSGLALIWKRRRARLSEATTA